MILCKHKMMVILFLWAGMKCGAVLMVAGAMQSPPSAAYQKLPPCRALFAGAGENSLKSLIGPPCPEAFNI